MLKEVIYSYTYTYTIFIHIYVHILWHYNLSSDFINFIYKLRSTSTDQCKQWVKQTMYVWIGKRVIKCNLITCRDLCSNRRLH